MHSKSRGYFIVLSGLIIATLIALVGWWAWKIWLVPLEPPKPTIVDSSGKPLIVGEGLPTEDISGGVAQNTGKNPGVKEEPLKTTELPPVPEIISSSGEKGTWIFVDKANFRLYLVDGNEVHDSWGICVGEVPGNKEKTGDRRTPEGSFTVQQIQPAGTWSHDFKDGKGVIKGAYGPWFIRLKAGGWKGIGIHGTHDPDSIGTMATEGCIRLKNKDVEELKSKIKVGTKVVIGPNAEAEDSAEN